MYRLGSVKYQLDFQQCKTPVVPYFGIFNKSKPQAYLIFAF